MNIHVFIGKDDYLVGEAAKRFVGEGAGLEIIDSVCSTNADLQLADLRAAEESCLTASLFEPSKVTWWKNVGFLPGSKSSEEVKTALEKFAERLAENGVPEGQQLIITAPQLLKGSVFAKKLAGVAEIAFFGASGNQKDLDQTAAIKAKELAEECGLKFEAKALESFVAVVGFDTRSLISEVNKMKCYLGERTTITEEDVWEITSQGVKEDMDIWGVTNAIAARDMNKALEEIRKFDLDGNKAVGMVQGVASLFRQLVDVKAASEAGKIKELSARMNPYAIQKNLGFARNWTLRELKVARHRFLALRENVVSGTVAGGVLLVAEIVRACRRPSR